ncbi:MAG TPA: hypothetical protein VFE40_01060, partial [Jatrophihabitantaceae bacterium]|nr:hypothetical protein [Jatrophihabitantaceae bacterium]
MSTLTMSPPQVAVAAPSMSGRFAVVGRWFANRGVRTKVLFAVGLLAAVAIASTSVAAAALSKAGSDIKNLASAQQSVIAP